MTLLKISDLKQLKESRKQFERMSNELETALVKNVDASKQKPAVCEETEKSVLGMRKSFGHVSLDYISQINKFYCTRSFSILDMVSYKNNF
jgi:Arf-GAP/coiled-coil/ANK repeat/PH domain-containing protein